MILRCTANLLETLGCRSGDIVAADPSPDDWYGDMFWVDRRKCLHLMHAGTLFAIFVPDILKANLSPLGPFLIHHIENTLADEGLPANTFGRQDPTDVGLAKTASRSLLGCMRQDRQFLQRGVAMSGGLASCDPRQLNHELHRTVHLPGGRGVVWPLDEAHRQARLCAQQTRSHTQ
jgi:hypothetical protein